MKDNEYLAARETLHWTHGQLGLVLGVATRSPYRYASGDRIPPPVARLLRLLVLLRLTLSKPKFEEIIKQLD